MVKVQWIAQRLKKRAGGFETRNCKGHEKATKHETPFVPFALLGIGGWVLGIGYWGLGVAEGGRVSG
jgi:hypothetical protein